MAERGSLDADDKKVVDRHTVKPAHETLGYDYVDHDYLAKPKAQKFYRSVLCQMLLFGALAFVGPSMADAISNLGGGGLSNPDLANLAQSLNYAGTCIMTIVGGPLINKIGIKWACLINAVCFWMSGTGFYVNIKYKVGWWLIVAKIITGLTNGFLYIGESAAMLTYPPLEKRGLYLSIWAGMRNSGSVLGGAIAFGVNYKTAGAGAVALATYVIFITFESTGPFWALLLSQTKDVRRHDGTVVPMSGPISWREEFKALAMHMRNKRTWLVAIPAFYSFFPSAVNSTFLGTHFSVRSRALSSFIYPAIAVLSTLAFGKFLDYRRLSQKQRAWCGFALWAIPQLAGLVWLCILWNHTYPNKVTLDYKTEPGKWFAAYFPYLLVQSTSYWVQIYCYWILSTFSTDVKAAARTGGLFRAFETAGQTTSYAVCGKSFRGKYMTFASIGVFAAAAAVLPALIKMIPETPSLIDDVVGDKAEFYVGETQVELDHRRNVERKDAEAA